MYRVIHSRNIADGPQSKVPTTSSSSITWKLSESADCQVPPKPSEAETLGVGLDLTSPPGDSLVQQILRTVASQ